jgi:hypothetical protein
MLIKRLDEFLNQREINTLIRRYVFNKDIDVQEIKDKLLRERSYEIRKHSHASNARNVKVREINYERMVWNYFIHQQIQNGKTTGDLAKELDKELEFLNSFF